LSPNIEHTKAKDTPVQAREARRPYSSEAFVDVDRPNLLGQMIKYVFT